MTTTISGSSGIVFPDLTSMQTGQQAVKAWVNFNGTGTVAIRAGYNVSSITDNGVGDYTVNFTTALSDANYAVSLGSVGFAPTNSSVISFIKPAGNTAPALKTTTQLTVFYSAASAGGGTYDASEMNVTVFR